MTSTNLPTQSLSNLLLTSILLISVAVYSFSTSINHANAQTLELEFREHHRTGRVIVEFKPLVPKLIQSRIIDQSQARLSERLLAPRTKVFRVPRGRETEVASKLNSSYFVASAEPDTLVQSATTPNDPLYPQQWHLGKINAPQAWETTTGSPEVVIAIVDSGVDSNHPDLVDKVINSTNFTTSISTDDNFGHGTHVAGVASAWTNNDLGIAGVDWYAKLLSIKVLDDSGSGFYSWVINGIYWAVDNGAQIINVSLGGPFDSPALRSAIEYAKLSGVTVVAAAGNNGSDTQLFYPAAYDSVIGVANTDQADELWTTSNYGSWITVAAPGVSIISTYAGNLYATATGTSMSTPIVTGSIGLIKSIIPNISPEEITGLITQSTESIHDSEVEFGRIDLNQLVKNAQTIIPTPTISPTPTIITPTPTTQPTLTPSPAPTSTPNPTPTSTPSPTPAFSPSPTPTLANTPPPTPTDITPTPTPILRPQPRPSWFCQFIPWARICRQ